MDQGRLDAIRDGLPTDLPDTGFKTTVRSPCRIRAMDMLVRSGRGSHNRGALATCPEFYGGGPVLPIRLARNGANGSALAEGHPVRQHCTPDQMGWAAQRVHGILASGSRALSSQLLGWHTDGYAIRCSLHCVRRMDSVILEQFLELPRPNLWGASNLRAEFNLYHLITDPVRVTLRATD
jgi:hypothetical protein